MPTETHRHFNPQGELVGYTEIIRESPWDEDARSHAEALFEAERMICPKCGNPREVCSQPGLPWYPQRSTCYAKAAEEIADRAWSAVIEGKFPDVAMKPRDGTHVWASSEDLTPDDDFISLPAQ